MRAVARRVGAFISTAKFNALNGHSIQEIETWDDVDERAADGVRGLLAAGRSVVDQGDDAQLLAGATAALLDDPGIYERATAALNDALDSSYRHDPIWGPIRVDSVYQAPSRGQWEGADMEGYVTVDAPERGQKSSRPRSSGSSRSASRNNSSRSNRAR